MKLQQIESSKLIVAKYNPASRTDKRVLQDLLESIKTHGILSPLSVDKELNVIDGHRRLACAKLLKLESVPAIISDSKLTNHELYEVVNTNSKKIAASDMIYIYTRGGKVPAAKERLIKKLEEVIGKVELKRFGDSYTSPFIFRIGKDIANYSHDKSPDFLRQIILWVFNHKQSFQVRRAIEDRIDRTILRKAITSNRPLKRDWKA